MKDLCVRLIPVISFVTIYFSPDDDEHGCSRHDPRLILFNVCQFTHLPTSLQGLLLYFVTIVVNSHTML